MRRPVSMDCLADHTIALPRFRYHISLTLGLTMDCPRRVQKRSLGRSNSMRTCGFNQIFRLVRSAAVPKAIPMFHLQEAGRRRPAFQPPSRSRSEIQRSTTRKGTSLGTRGRRCARSPGRFPEPPRRERSTAGRGVRRTSENGGTRVDVVISAVNRFKRP